MPSFVINILLFLNEYWSHVAMNYVKELNNVIGVYFVFNIIVGQIFMTKMFMVLYINNLLNSRQIKTLLELESSFSNFFKHIKTKLINYFVQKEREKKQIQSAGARAPNSKLSGFINSQHKLGSLKTGEKTRKSSNYEFFKEAIRTQIEKFGEHYNLEGIQISSFFIKKIIKVILCSCFQKQIYFESFVSDFPTANFLGISKLLL